MPQKALNIPQINTLLGIWRVEGKSLVSLAKEGNNILDSQSRIGHPFPKLKKRKKPVTVIVGIICKCGIVLASDSQTTFSDDSKRCDSEKIRLIKFKDSDDKVLIAQSGRVETSSRIIDVMERLAAERKLENEETVLKTVQDAMRKVRDELRYQHFDCSAEELKKIMFDESLNCGLMAAHFCNSKPFIHTFDFSSGTTTTSKSFFESTGCGSALANYILSELCSPEMDSRLGEAIAVYTVDKAIKHVAYCDRPIRLAVVYSWKPQWIVPDRLHGLLNASRPSSDEPSLATRLALPQSFLVDNVSVKDLAEVEQITAKVSKIDEETKPQRIEKLRAALWSYADTLLLPNFSYPNLSEGEQESNENLYE